MTIFEMFTQFRYGIWIATLPSLLRRKVRTLNDNISVGNPFVTGMLGCVVVRGDDLDELLGCGRAVTQTFDLRRHRKNFDVKPARNEKENADINAEAVQANRQSIISTFTTSSNLMNTEGAMTPASEKSSNFGNITLRGCPGGGYELNIYSARRLELPGPDRQPFAVVYWNSEEIGDKQPSLSFKVRNYSLSCRCHPPGTEQQIKSII
jgi:hypothetical protein